VRRYVLDDTLLLVKSFDLIKVIQSILHLKHTGPHKVIYKLLTCAYNMLNGRVLLRLVLLLLYINVLCHVML